MLISQIEATERLVSTLPGTEPLSRLRRADSHFKILSHTEIKGPRPLAKNELMPHNFWSLILESNDNFT